MLYEWVADFARTGEVSTLTRTRWTGKQRLTDTYRWLNDMPLRDGDDALKVGWCELTTTDANGQVLYRNAWASSQPIEVANGRGWNRPGPGPLGRHARNGTE